MSSSRLPSLFGALLRPLESRPVRSLRTSSWVRQPQYPGSSPVQQQHRLNASFRRHGKAVEPQQLKPHPSPEEPKDKDSVDSIGSDAAKPSSEPTETPVAEVLGPRPAGSFGESGNLPPIGGNMKFSDGQRETSFGNTSSRNDGPPHNGPATNPPLPPLDGSLEMVIHQADMQNNPSTSRYIHHFDSFTAVQQLQKGGYTEAQAITLMKAIRGQLSTRLAGAQQALLSKSDVENEIYLFRAACSELGNEVKNNRRIADEQMRRERTHLQHELDILGQSLGQEISGMNDTVKGMVNDRSMSQREEHKSLESSIQQLNYKISIMLTSDAKSDIETIRWILIRRAVLGILFMAVISLTLIQVTSSTRAERKQKEAAEAKARRDEKEKRKAAEALAAAAQAAAQAAVVQAEERSMAV